MTTSQEPGTAVDEISVSMSTPGDVTSMTMTSELPVVNRSHVWTPDVIQRVATLLPLMAATLLGNVITMIVLTCSRYRSVNSRINIFIANLAAGDLAVCCFTMSTEVVLSVALIPAWVHVTHVSMCVCPRVDLLRLLALGLVIALHFYFFLSLLDMACFCVIFGF